MLEKLKVKMQNAENGKLERLFFFLAGDTKEKADNRQQIWEICLKNIANWREHLKHKINLKKLQLKDGDCSYEQSRSGSEQC